MSRNKKTANREQPLGERAQMIDKLPFIPVILAAFGALSYMFYQREWELQPDSVAVFVILALLFSAAQWGLKKRRGH
jgi:hypothetical protein